LLRDILTNLDPNFVPAIEELIAIAEADDDYPSLAIALERQRALARRAEERATSASLADLYEDKLRDLEKMLASLRSWTEAAPLNPEPLRECVPSWNAAGVPRLARHARRAEQARTAARRSQRSRAGSGQPS